MKRKAMYLSNNAESGAVVVSCLRKLLFSGMKQLGYGIALSLVAFTFFSCKDEYSICTLSKSVNFIGGFYQRTGGVDVAVQAPSLSVGLLNGPNLVSQQQNASVTVIPLNPTIDSARFLISVANNLQSDTLTVIYSSQTVILSAECGDVITHNIARFYSTTHTIDSVKLISPAVNTNPVQNAKIYF